MAFLDLQRSAYEAEETLILNKCQQRSNQQRFGIDQLGM